MLPVRDSWFSKQCYLTCPGETRQIWSSNREDQESLLLCYHRLAEITLSSLELLTLVVICSIWKRTESCSPVYLLEMIRQPATVILPPSESLSSLIPDEESRPLLPDGPTTILHSVDADGHNTRASWYLPYLIIPVVSMHALPYTQS